MLQLIAAAVAEIGRNIIEDWRTRRQNQRDVERAVTENRIRLATSEQEHNQEWEMRALEGHDRAVRRLSFAIWSAPAVWAIFDPAGVATYFGASLAALPDWYKAGYLGITGAVWGLAELKAAGVIRK